MSFEVFVGVECFLTCWALPLQGCGAVKLEVGENPVVGIGERHGFVHFVVVICG